MNSRTFIAVGIVVIQMCMPALGHAQSTVEMQIPNPGNPDINPISVAVPVIPPSSFYTQLSLKNMSVDEALKIYLDRLKKDPSFEGKVALSFFGKVVDENGQPVVGASARLMWNTIAVPGGTAFRRVSSDKDGLFSLEGQCGKCLGVRVEKDGYYSVEGGRGEVNFEYAEPSSPYWYEPDPNKPIIFHLRTKGKERSFSPSI